MSGERLRDPSSTVVERDRSVAEQLRHAGGQRHVLQDLTSRFLRLEPGTAAGGQVDEQGRARGVLDPGDRSRSALVQGDPGG